MHLPSLRSLFLSALIALISTATFAGTRPQLQYSYSLDTGTVYTTDCSEAVLKGTFRNCSNVSMAPNFPVEYAPPPNGSMGRCDYGVNGATSSCGGYGGTTFGTISSGYTCGNYAILPDGTCDTPKEEKSLGACPKSCEDNLPAEISPVPDPVPSIEVGNPINSASGNKFEAVTDYQGQGPFALRFTRYYNSAAPLEVAPIGARWRHSYSRSITLAADGLSANITRTNGRVYHFVLSNGNWIGDWDVPEQLTRQPDNTWRYRNRSDETETYDANGRLLSIANRAGVLQTLTYDTNGRLTQITDTFGRSLTLGYNASNLITTLTDPANGQYTYSYDAIGNLTAITYPDGKTRQHLYENATFKYALTGIIDENNQRYATFGYDNQGRANLSEHAGGAGRVNIAFDDASPVKRSAVTDALGVTRTYDYAMPGGVYRHKKVTRSCAGCQTVVESETVYNSDGTIFGNFDANRILTRLIYDSRNLLTYRGKNANNSPSKVAAWNWHPTYRLPTVFNDGVVQNTFAYDSFGNLTSKTQVSPGVIGTPQSPRTWTYTYNANGQILTEDGPRTDVLDKTSYEYDSAGNLIKITNAVGHITQLANYDAHGKPGRITDANGLITDFTYDTRGRLISRQTGTETTTYQYDNAGQLTKVTLPSGAFIAYTYDAAHQLIGITDTQGNRVAYTLDAMGNRIKDEVFTPGNVLTQTHSRVFDALNRLLQDIGASNQTTTYTYDNAGNLLTTTDPLNHTTTQVYDGLYRITSSTDAASAVTQYLYYNSEDVIDRVIDPRNQMTSSAINYNDSLRPTISYNPDATVSNVYYDTASNVVSRRDGKEQTTTYQYDALNRLTRETRADGSSVTYQYDSGINQKGRLTQMTDPSGSTTWQYDLMGRLTQKTQTIAGVNLITEYSYNNAGQLTAVIYPSGRQVNYTWTNGKLTGIAQNGTAIASNITYQPFGAVKSWTFANGQSVNRSFDLDGRMTGHSLGTITYDAASRITGLSLGGLSQLTGSKTYGYDSVDRLTSFSDGATPISYAYDQNGNRTSQSIGGTTNNYVISSSSNRINSISGGGATLNYTYDGNGSIVNDGTLTYTYNAAGRLIAAGSGNSYVYNGLGQRVKKTTANGTVLFAYDEAGKLIGEYNQAGNLIQETVYLGDAPLAVGKASGTYYVHTDHLNTPRQINNQQGQVVWTWEVATFGASQPNENPSGLGVFKHHGRHPGQYADEETGNFYNYYRDCYDPRTGRYCQSDPIGLAGGLNTYAYVAGNPISYADPRGLDNPSMGPYGPRFRGPGLTEADMQLAANGCVDIGGGLQVCVGPAAIEAVGAKIASAFCDVVANRVKVVARDGDIVELLAKGANGDITAITKMTKEGDQLILEGTHIGGPGKGTSSLSELRDLARDLGRQNGVDSVVIRGGQRTTGASPGKVPRDITIKVK